MPGILGWSCPPGCSGSPDEGRPCNVCFLDPNSSGTHGCICPECEVCKETGNPDCYATSNRVKHGLIISDRVRERQALAQEMDRQKYQYFRGLAEANRSP